LLRGEDISDSDDDYSDKKRSDWDLEVYVFDTKHRKAQTSAKTSLGSFI
jgi:hypothetical protein